MILLCPPLSMSAEALFRLGEDNSVIFGSRHLWSLTLAKTSHLAGSFQNNIVLCYRHQMAFHRLPQHRMQQRMLQHIVNFRSLVGPSAADEEVYMPTCPDQTRPNEGMEAATILLAREVSHDLLAW